MPSTCHPLDVQRFGRKGWFFLSCPDIPGVNLFGPDIDELFESAEIAIAELLKARGEKLVRVTIEAVPDDQEDGPPAWAIPNKHMAMAFAA